MTRARTVHVCSECGAEAPRWAGRCASCGEWNTLAEQVIGPILAGAAAPGSGGRSGRLSGRQLAAQAMTEHGTRTGSAGDSAVLLSEIDPQLSAPLPTGVAELDRVLGGGLVPGSVTLLGGEPGIG